VATISDVPDATTTTTTVVAPTAAKAVTVTSTFAG
jgi:hypothetical protein